MKNSFIYSFIIFSFLLSHNAEVMGQRWKLQRYELAPSIGTTTSFMDVGSGAQEALQAFQINSSRFSAGTYLGYKITNGFEVKLDLNYLILGGSDANRIPERYYHFISHGFEHSIRLDVDLFNIGRQETTAAVFTKRGMINNFGSAEFFLFTGFGSILSKAKVYDENNVEVIPIDPEGNYELDEYILSGSADNTLNYSPVLSAGFLLKLELTNYIDLGFEAGGRMGLWKSRGWSDAIDGYNNPTEVNKYSDRYIVINVKAIYSIRSKRNGLPDFKSIGRGGF